MGTRLTSVISDLTGISVESEILPKVLLSSFVVLGLLLGRRLLLRVVDRKLEDARTRYRWSKTSAYVAFAIGVAVVLQIWFEAVRSLGTFLGLLSAGLAIALKDPVANLAGWVFILWRRPFDLGDRIQIGPHAGDVVDLRIFQFTILEIGNWVDADQSTGRIIHIPNQKVFTEPTANYTDEFEYIWNEVAVQLTFDSDWRRAKEILADIAQREVGHYTAEAERSMQEAARTFLIYYRKLTPIVYTSVKESGVVLTVRYLCKARHRRGTAQGIWESVLEEFGRRPDIAFAYPTRRLYATVVDRPAHARPSPDLPGPEELALDGGGAPGRPPGRIEVAGDAEPDAPPGSS